MAIINLLSPLITSNRTSSVTGNPVGYYFKFADSGKKGLSFNTSTAYLKMQNENFSIYGTDTKGQVATFNGTLKATLFTVKAALGKNFMTKDGRLLLFLAPFAAYGFSFDHTFDYGGAKVRGKNNQFGPVSIWWHGELIHFYYEWSGINHRL